MAEPFDNTTENDLTDELQQGTEQSNVDINSLQTIADHYKPKELDKQRWDATWRSTILQETGGNANIGEAKGGKRKTNKAYGLAQVTPETAEAMGFTRDEIRTDPLANFAAGVKYLSGNYSAVRGHRNIRDDEHAMLVAAAGYHAGRERTIANLDRDGDGVPDVDDGNINTRDYTLQIAERMRPFLESIHANERQNSIKVGEDIDNAQAEAGKTGVETTQTPEGITTGVVSRQPQALSYEEQQKANNTEQMFADAQRRVSEMLGLTVAQTHPHKMAGNTTVMIPFTPGQNITADVISDAITDNLTQQPGFGQKFRQATGENPGQFRDDITNEWLKRELESGRAQYDQENGVLIAKIPVQNYVKNRIDAFAAGGAKGVEENTAAMRREISESERLVAEQEYGQQIAQLNKQADEATDENVKKQLQMQATALQSDLDKKYPTSWYSGEELWRGVKKGIAQSFGEYQQLGLNMRNLYEAATTHFTPEEQKRAAQRDKDYQNLVNQLRRETPEARTVLGNLAETLTQAVSYDAPVYFAGGAVLGPSGIVYTTAARSAHKPFDEFAGDIAAALIEIPVGRAVGGFLTRAGGEYGVHELGEKAIGRFISGGVGEVSGDAIVDLINGKKFDAMQALRNFVAGGAFEIGSKESSEAGGETKVAEPRQFVEPKSPIAVTIGEDGKPRYQMMLGNEQGVGLVEIPANHPYVLKYAAEVEKGNLAFMQINPDQFDQALKDFGEGAPAKLPKLTAEQTAKYLEATGTQRSAETKETTNGSERGQQVRSEERVGQDNVQANVESRGETQGQANGVLQEREQVQEESQREEPKLESQVLDTESNPTLASAAEKLGTSSAKEIGDLLANANKRFRLSNTDQEQQVADEAYEKVKGLTNEENKALGEVLPERFYAPVKTPSIPGKTGDYSASVKGKLESDKVDAQLEANIREAESFFEERGQGKPVPEGYGKRTQQESRTPEQLEAEEAAETAVEKQKTESKQIAKGEKNVKLRGITVTLPQDLAQQWSRADETMREGLEKMSGTLEDKAKQRKELQSKRDAERKRIELAYRAREAEQFERGYLKDTERPLVIIGPTPGSSELTRVKMAGSDQIVDVPSSQVETRKARTVAPVKKGKLPFAVRARKVIGSFEEDKPRSHASGGNVFVNDKMRDRLEDVLGEEFKDSVGFTIRPATQGTIVKALRDAGENGIAKQIETQARNTGKPVIIASTNIEEAGKFFSHERIHQVADEQELSQGALERLFRDDGAVRTFVESAPAFMQALNPHDIVQEVLAYGLTGDSESLQMKPEVLADALLDVIEVYNREFPNETLNQIGEHALINFDGIQTEAVKRIKNEATKNSAVQKATGEAEVSTTGGSIKEGQKRRGKKNTSGITSLGLHAKQSQTPGGLDVNEKLAGIADEYTREHGLGAYNVGTYFNFKPEVYNQIADLMESNKHEPENPNVQRAYKALGEETVEQYKYLESKGMKFEPWKQEGQPYANSKEMRADVIDNDHLYFFTGGDMPTNHPMKADSGINIDGQELSINDVFRAVHDYFGHAVSGAQFGARGELNATDSHARMYSQEALPALVGETVFQNAWVNYGPHIRREDGSIPVKGDADFVPPQDRPFAEQKAMDITPEQLDLWRSAYTTPPRFNSDFISAEQAGVGKLSDRERNLEGFVPATGLGGTSRGNVLYAKRKPKVDAEIQAIQKKQADELTTADVQAVISRGNFAMISGNQQVGEAGELGEAQNKQLKAELEKMGYQVLPAEGRYTPEGEATTSEPSLFVVLKTPNDAANILRVGVKHNQAQVLLGEQGKFRAPYTMTTTFGQQFTETFGDRETLLFDKAAMEQAGQTIVDTSEGRIAFSVPEAFTRTRPMDKQETALVQRYIDAYQASKLNTALTNSGDFLDWLTKQQENGFRQDMSTLATAVYLRDVTEELYGEFPDAKKMSEEEYAATRVRRAVEDGLSFIKAFQRGKSREASGQSWYAQSIANMHQKTGEAFPEVMSVPQLRALFDLALAVSSQGNKVEVNYKYATDLWRRVVEEFKLGEDSFEIFPVRQKPALNKEGEITEKNYGRFGSQLEKVNMMMEGYVPVDNLTALKLKRKKQFEEKTVETKDFKNVNGAAQRYMKDPELEAMIEKHGRIGGMFEYLLQPGSTEADPYKAQEILGPKIGAFFLNIAGFSQLVTVDMWAARWFYRINGGLVNNDEIQDAPKNNTDGDTIRGVMQAISDEYNANHENKLSPADVQAILWYGEKDVWTKGGAQDSGQVDFFQAAERQIPDVVRDLDGIQRERERVIENWTASAPEPGQQLGKLGTVKATEENKQYFIKQMSVPARLGLAAQSSRQKKVRLLMNFDANSWNKHAEAVNGKPLDPQQAADLNNLLQAGYHASTAQQKEDALDNLHAFVDEIQYLSVPQFLMTYVKASMLGVKTQARNIISNLAHAALEEASKGAAAPLDILFAVGGKRERSVAGPSLSGIAYAAGKGFTDGVRAAKKTLLEGNAGASYETFNLGSDPKSGYKWLDSTLGNFAKYTFRALGATDAVFRTYAYHRALYEIAELEQKNGGRGIVDVLTDPTIEQSDAAWRIAEVLVFQNDNSLNTRWQQFKNDQPEGIKLLMDWTIPFTKTPINVFNRTMDYAVLGGVVDVAKALKNADVPLNLKGWEKVKAQMWDVIDKPESRKIITEAFGRGLVGMGIAYTGLLLAQAGLLYGMDDDDEKERERRKSQGAGPGHLRIGDRWYDIRQFAPFSQILISGASYHAATMKNMADESKRKDEYMKIIANMVYDGLPIARAGLDLLQPKFGSITERLLPAERLVPSVVNEVGQTTDKFQREITGQGFAERSKQKIQQRIPGQREKLPVKEDVLGRPLEQPAGYDPFASKKNVSDPVVKEATEVGWANDVQRETKTDKSTGKKTQEPAEQFQARKRKTSDLIYKAMQAALNNQEYPKTETKNERKDLLDDISAQARRQIKKGTTLDDSTLKDVVEAIIQRHKAKLEVEKDDTLNEEEKKKKLSGVSREFSSRINTND